MNNVEIGKRIKQRRLELGYTQSFIYNKTGISTGNLSGIEKGSSAPSASALCELSQILECSVDYILFGDSPKSENTCSSNIKKSLSPIQEMILSSLEELDSLDQEEVLDIIEMKIRRKKRLAKSLNSGGTSTSETA